MELVLQYGRCPYEETGNDDEKRSGAHGGEDP